MPYLTATLIFSIDSSIGRIDKTALPQETLMDLLIETLSNKETLRGYEDAPKDISEWKGLNYNKDNDIIKIDWSLCGLRGSVQLQWLPPTITDVRMWGNTLSGTLDLTVLPDGLEMLNIHSNMLSGTVDLTHLPPSLQDLAINKNQLEGTLDFTQLPEGLKFLHLDGNNFEGEADFSKLPESMTAMSVENTKLSGNWVHRGDMVFCHVGSKVKVIR